MKKVKSVFEYIIFNSLNELPIGNQELMNTAVKARESAYAPYSNFKVGAAVLLENGKVVIGSNQENASYPSGLCAERVAIFQAGALYPGVRIDSLAITATSVNYVVDRPAAPCGNCRQSIAEYEQKQKSSISIFMMGETGEIIKCNSLSDILPFAFDNSFLK
ncbi:cytidine deaminase [Saonia flava]|uniref:Cytidine deaminase n=1 Tax=Saonia flava TaxID=523696 RepID=A0A846R1G8_9FLAO|nr:cytidine deaminase [Saonia flava]NJB72802.1 cytidine deaminase [Saonia flava]